MEREEESFEELGIDTRGIPTHECLNCGSTQFKILASFENYELVWYTLQGYCYGCGAPVTVPCPVDDPEYVSYDN